MSGALWTLLGARNYLRHRAVDWRLLCGMMILGLAGAWFGAAMTVRVDPAVLKRVVGGLLLVFLAVMVARLPLGAEPGPPRVSRLIVGGFAIPMGFYEGMLGSGNSLVASLLFCVGRGYDLISALGHYYVLAFGWCALAAASYIGQGYGDLALMVPASVGSCAGGYRGSLLGIKLLLGL